MLTIIYHACQYEEETGKCMTAGVITSAVLLASCAISDIIDDIEARGVIAQLSCEVGTEAPELAPLLPLIRLAAAADERELDLIWRFAKSLIGEEAAV